MRRKRRGEKVMDVKYTVPETGQEIEYNHIFRPEAHQTSPRMDVTSPWQGDAEN
jgi:hypothetical protein